ncbi:MAG: RagB/SusD family nutrient uptake outer membrane protein [Flavitalea sp.]
MKTIYKLIAAYLFIPVFLTSCSKKFLDVIPEDQLSDAVFWKTENDANLALTGLYRGWEDYRQAGWIDMMSDVAYSKFPTPLQVMGNGQLNATNPGLSFFTFTQIRKYNNFLEKVDPIEMDQAKKDLYKAEVRFLRAYNYWRRIESYGDFPLVTATFNDAEEAKIGRNAKSEIVSFILSELTDVIPQLPVQTMRESGGHATRGAALALKARTELYQGMWAEAMADSKAIMDQGIYELYPNYNGLFDIDNEESNKESIMEIFYETNTYTNLIWVDMTAGNDGGGYAVIDPTDKIVSAYEMSNGKPITDPTSGYDDNQPFKNRDPRLDMTILHAGTFYNGRYFDPFTPGVDFWQNANSFRGAYGFTKFAKVINPALVDNCGTNFMVFRLAETLLTYAEAAIESNQITTEMYDAIDAVRVRAGMPVVDRTEYNTQVKLRELVRRERMVEFPYEGLRYYDIKRWDIGAQVIDGPLYGSKLGSVNPTTGELTLTSEKILLENRIFHPERHYLLPIPQSQLDVNPNLKQNDGY